MDQLKTLLNMRTTTSITFEAARKQAIKVVRLFFRTNAEENSHPSVPSLPFPIFTTVSIVTSVLDSLMRLLPNPVYPNPMSILQEQKDHLCHTLIDILPSDNIVEDATSCDLVQSAIGMSVFQHVMDNYLHILTTSCYGNEATNVFGAVSASIFVYRDVGLEKSGTDIPQGVLDNVSKLFRNRAVIFFPLYIPGHHENHWALAVVYPRLHTIVFLDSGFSQNNYEQLSEVK